MIVREVRWNDFDDLREMYYDLYDERDRGDFVGLTLYSDRPTLVDEVAWFAGAYRRYLEGDTVWSVAEDGGRVVGSCEVRREGASVRSEAGHVGVLGILVRRGHRGRGVGTALLTHALAACHGRFDQVLLSVFVENARAKQLYEQFGFVTVGHRPRHVRRAERFYDADEMVLDLPAVARNP